jgi:hypothetical protein
MLFDYDASSKIFIISYPLALQSTWTPSFDRVTSMLSLFPF